MSEDKDLGATPRRSMEAGQAVPTSQLSHDALQNPITSIFALKAVVDASYAVGYRAGAAGVQQARNVVAAEIHKASRDTSYGLGQRRALMKVAEALGGFDPSPNDAIRVSWEPQYETLFVSDGAPIVADSYELAPFVCLRVSRDSDAPCSLEVSDVRSFLCWLNLIRRQQFGSGNQETHAKPADATRRSEALSSFSSTSSDHPIVDQEG